MIGVVRWICDPIHKTLLKVRRLGRCGKSGGRICKGHQQEAARLYHVLPPEDHSLKDAVMNRCGGEGVECNDVNASLVSCLVASASHFASLIPAQCTESLPTF